MCEEQNHKDCFGTTIHIGDVICAIRKHGYQNSRATLKKGRIINLTKYFVEYAKDNDIYKCSKSNCCLIQY